MNNFCKITLFTALITLSSYAHAIILFSPSSIAFGPVPAGDQATASLTVLNESAEIIQSFTVNSVGDSSDFPVFSSCFRLEAYGTCTVTVQFTPKRGDNSMHFMTLYGQGSNGAFATADVSGTDAPARK